MHAIQYMLATICWGSYKKVLYNYREDHLCKIFALNTWNMNNCLSDLTSDHNSKFRGSLSLRYAIWITVSLEVQYIILDLTVIYWIRIYKEANKTVSRKLLHASFESIRFTKFWSLNLAYSIQYLAYKICKFCFFNLFNSKMLMKRFDLILRLNCG